MEDANGPTSGSWRTKFGEEPHKGMFNLKALDRLNFNSVFTGLRPCGIVKTIFQATAQTSTETKEYGPILFSREGYICYSLCQV